MQSIPHLRRATVARSALDIIALVFLFAGFAFWAVAFWQLLAPPQLLSLLSIQAAVLAVAFSLAAPLLLSMLVPTTPAGQLLQKTQWATVGFYVILAAAFYLTYQAEQLIEVWLYAQPGIAEVRYERRLAIVLVIAFVVVPALAWVQLTPERWVQSVQQAHAVKKLEMQHRGELAILKASILRSERLALKGWANLLPLEKEEVFHTVRGLLQSTSDIQRDIVRTMALGADLERDIIGDQEIADQLDYVKDALDVLPDIAPAYPQNETQSVSAALASAHQDATPAISAPLRAVASLPQSAAVSGSSPQFAAEYAAARAKLSGVWSTADLADVIGKSPRSALDRTTAWIAAGLVQRGDDGKGTYYFTERGGA